MTKSKEHNLKNDGFKTPDGYFDSFKDRLFDKMEAGVESLPKKEGFTTPEGYFDKLEDKIVSSSIEGNAMPKSHGMTAPEGYFENFEQRLFDRIEQNNKEAKVIKLAAYKKYVYAAVAVAAALALLFTVFYKPDVNTIDSLPTAYIDELIDDGLIAMDSYEIAEVFDEQEINISDLMEDTYDYDNMIEYISDNIDDLDQYEDLILEN